ncbi:hypothetical protein V3C33_00625 [Micrococcaceae bacterium Sec5.7]
MTRREPVKMRKALLAGALVAALTVTGAAVVWAASDPALAAHRLTILHGAVH